VSVPLPSRTGDPTRDLEAIWGYLAAVRADYEQTIPQGANQANHNGALGADPLALAPVIIPAIDFGVPAAPQGLSATPFFDAIGLAWQMILDPTITGYEVSRATDAGFTANVTIRTQALALQYIDVALGGSGVTFFYRVRAVRQAFDGAVSFSGYSDVKTATTTAESAQLAQIELYAATLQTLHIKNAVIDSARIADASIITAKIADLAVASAKIADLAVTTAKIASLAVTDAKIATLSADKIIAGTITVLVKLTNNAIELDGVNSVINIFDAQGTPKIRVKLGKLGVGSTDWGLRIFASDGVTTMWDALDQGAQTAGIKDLAIAAAKIAAQAVETAKIKDAAVDYSKRQGVFEDTWNIGDLAGNAATNTILIHNLGLQVIATIQTSNVDIGVWVRTNGSLNNIQLVAYNISGTTKNGNGTKIYYW
jgi:hypothetical protein